MRSCSRSNSNSGVTSGPLRLEARALEAAAEEIGEELLLLGRAWKAATAASRILATWLTVPVLIPLPRMGNKATATLRVDSPSTKQG